MRLWRLMLPDRLPRHRDVVPETLAQETEGMTGAEIREAVLGAAARAVMRRGRARRVTLEDVRAELARLRKAQEHVGAKD